MKKLALMMAIVLVTSSVVGCGCCRRIRNAFNRGAYVGAPAATTPTYIAPAPAPIVVPQQPAPVMVPQASTCVPYQPSCEPCCQPVCDPCCQPTCDPCCTPTPTSYPVYDGGCDGCIGGVTGTIGSIPSQGVIDPGPVPAGP